MSLMSHNKAVEEYLLTAEPAPPALADTIDPSAPTTGMPSKRGRPAVRKEPEKAARMLGLGVAAQELAEAGIVGVENRHGDRVGRVRLGVSEEEVRGALREDDECEGLGLAGG